MGSFIIDALGVRWACDLGADDYNMPGYFGDKRWTYYRLRAEGHNTLVIQSGKTSKVPDQNPKAVAPIVKFNSQPGRVVAVADLSTAYGGMARQARRGIALVDRKRVLVQDEVETAMPSDVWWFMTAPAASTGRSSRRAAEAAHMSMELGKDSSEAMLSKDKARLWVHIVARAARSSKFWVQNRFPRPPIPASRMPTPASASWRSICQG